MLPLDIRDKGRKSKYKNQKTIINGIVFDSKKEATRYAQLIKQQQIGLIKNLRRQVKYELTPRFDFKPVKNLKTKKLVDHYNSIYYVADFVYEEKGQTIVEDVKGFETKEYKIKRTLMYAVHGIVIREV